MKKTKTLKGENMITLKIKRSKDYRTSYLNGKEEILSFEDSTKLTNYFMREFASWKPYNKLYWEFEAEKWFDTKFGDYDDDTLYYFGGEFSIKLLEERV